jgi:hypothetical protein
VVGDMSIPFVILIPRGRYSKACATMPSSEVWIRPINKYTIYLFIGISRAKS